MPVTSETASLRRLILKHPDDAVRDPADVAAEARALNYLGTPDLARAREEYARFVDLVGRTGAEILRLPRAEGVGLDSIYTRDASVASPKGMILASMGKPERSDEPAAQAAAFVAWDVPVAGAIQPPARLEGGDVVWLDDRIVAVGRGYRTNAAGIRALGALLAGTVDELIEVPLPHWKGPADVFHLMSVISPVDRRLAVVYGPLLPVPFRERLLELGFAFVEVPREEFESMGANVLALAPGECVMLAGNRRTQAALERAGVRVWTYEGAEISVKGGGGPTCLTRPVARDGSTQHPTPNNPGPKTQPDYCVPGAGSNTLSVSFLNNTHNA
jgi:N-dimethylarginine dimethylaminohydrolase